MRDGPCLWVKEASKNGVQTGTSTVSLRARLLVDLGPDVWKELLPWARGWGGRRWLSLRWTPDLGWKCTPR